MADTAKKILDKALEMFNEQGIEYVGMRELATSLNMRIGNITYYFPTKDHLVFRLSEQYSSANSRIHTEMPVSGLFDLLHKTEMIFRNQVRYRCYLLSMVHLMEQNKLIADYYKGIQSMRMNLQQQNIRTLCNNKYLKLAKEDEWFLVSINSLIGRFWMSEAALSGKRQSLDREIAHYLKLIASLFKPYATKKGLQDIERFITRK
jgi:AcrR family transcriptional regulator